jgi:hypothetical protein
MNGKDLFSEIQEKTKLMDQSLSDLPRRGRDYAQAEQAYRVALAKRMLIERNNKMPTTIIGDICRGNEEVAALKFDRDCKEAYYKAVMEGINVLKIEVRIDEGQLDREYNRK